MSSPQGDFNDYVVNKELDFWFGAVAIGTAPTTLYFGLATTHAYNLNGTLTEVPATILVNNVSTATGYARVAKTNNATNFPAAIGRIKRNGTAIIFPVPALAWGLVRSWFIVDHPTNMTNIIASGTIWPHIQINAGDLPPTFAINALVLTR